MNLFDFNTVKNLYELFTLGTPIFALFVIVTVGLIFMRTDKTVLMNYLVPTVILTVIVLNPITMAIGLKGIGSELRLVRVYWLFPVVVVFAFILTKLLFYKESRRYRTFVVAMSVAAILFFGKYMFSADNFSASENLYKVPNDVIEICQAIEEDGNEGLILPNPEYVEYYRQYDANMKLVYGRDAYLNNYYIKLGADVYDMKWVGAVLKSTKAKYWIATKDRKTSINLNPKNYSVLCEVGDYVIYKCTI
ncbi:MAG: hypothetical protein E7241_00270 [Lachnospiraceae bacterium]|nr:hypothetical protein [Lachnospiraceae bacterium]